MYFIAMFLVLFVIGKKGDFMLLLSNVTKEFGNKTIFDCIDLTIYDGEKVGIIGDNGQGKTTLLNLITGNVMADSGKISREGKIGYLYQSSEISIEDISKKLNDPSTKNLFLEYLSKFGMDTSLNYDKEIIKKLSGGERTKLILALLYSDTPDILILDEPTNHLDTESKDFLIEQINALNSTVLIVSHDRDFLNKTVDKIIEVKNGKITEYNGNYDDYIEQKNIYQLNLQRDYESHKNKIVEINKDIVNYKNAVKKADAKKSKNAKKSYDFLTADARSTSLSKFVASRVSKLQQELDRDIEKPEKNVQIKYKLKIEDLKVKNAIIVENITKKFGDRVIFENANFIINSGERIALLGANGTGKTTFINMLLGKDEDYTGFIRKTPSLNVATMFQDIYDLDETLTINEMSILFDKEYRTYFISNLVGMNIDKSRFDTEIKYLSMGERMRIKLCQIILSDANMIILDEPTNHLDIASREFLEKTLQNFVGTLLVVSHDTKFIQNCTNSTLLIKNKTLTKF